MNLSAWCSRIIRTSFYLLFILVPLVLTPWNYELFEYNKMVVTYGFTVIIFCAWLLKMVTDREIRVAHTPLDIPIALFVLSQLISALFSMDPHVSWFGYYSRFNGGMWSVFSYVILYYALVTHAGETLAIIAHTIRKKAVAAASTIPPLPTPVKRLLNVTVTTAALVAFYGVAEHFGIDKHLWVQDVQSRVFSTLGQPNWLAAFLVAVIPVSFYFFIANSPRATPMQVLKYLFGGVTAVLFFLVLLYTRSRSGLLGLAVTDILFWGILLTTSPKSPTMLRKKIVHQWTLIHIIFAVIIFFNGVYIVQIDRWFTFAAWKNRITHIVAPAPKAEKPQSGTLLDSGGTESGTIRKYVWQAAVTAWRASTKNVLIGTGTETFAFAFYRYRPQGHNMTSEWDFLYNKAHNEYLNYLATTGIFGLGSYLILIGTFIVWFIRNYIMKTSGQKILPLALFAGWVSILVTNFFGFSVVIIQLFFFLFPALTIVLIGKTAFHVFPLRLSDRVRQSFSYALILALCVLLVLLYRYWRADTFFSTGYRLARANQYVQAQEADSRAITLNPGEPLYRDEMATTIGSLVLAAVDAQNATLAASLARQSLAENDLAIRTSPNNVNFWKTRTKLYYSFSTFDPELNKAAIKALETAQALSPNDPKIEYNLAILTGRQGENDRAIEYLNKAKSLKPDYRDAYFGLYVFYTEIKQPDKARAELQYYLDHVDPKDQDFKARLTQ